MIKKFTFKDAANHLKLTKTLIWKDYKNIREKGIVKMVADYKQKS